MLGLIRSLNYSFSTIVSLLLLYVTLVRPVLECAPPVWSRIMATDAIKLERNERKFAFLCFKRFFPPLIDYNYSYALEILKLDALKVKGQQVDAVF